MKVWELKEGVEYKADYNGCEFIYKIANVELLVKCIGETEFDLSCISYNDAMLLDFTEYIPPTDWSKVEVDTKVLVRDWYNSEWVHRYFAIYKNGRIHTWNNGHTSFTSRDKDDYVPYNQAKLYTEE